MRAWTEILNRLTIDDAGYGYDRFGMSPGGVRFGLNLTAGFYDRWFRVESSGLENIPRKGAAIIAANHSGTLPLDALMIWADIVRKTDPVRVPRVVADHFVGMLPWVGAVFTRAGAVGGSRGNFHALLDAGELIGVFPEGVPGIGKPFSERYQLQHWREGHAELAIRHQVPVIPTAVIGAEEQMPQLGRIDIHPFGIPYLPIMTSLFPLPVKYRILYGEPIDIPAQFTADQANSPDAVAAAAALVRTAVEALISQGLGERQGVFS